ncbi:MAG: T9SS type A sorting domain-containing protein [Prolixibacteraceae bacterium]|nr:T9SS type A sorting domain-containing protein [Prolixibacteraceae bacterium]
MKRRMYYKKYSTLKKGLLLTCFTLLGISTLSIAGTGIWNSRATGGEIVYTSSEAPSPVKDMNGNYVTVVYLENLGFGKIGQNSNTEDVAWLLLQGYRVVKLDYANNASAVAPTINLDIIAINDSISNGSFCGLVDCSKYQSYVLFEGYRIARNVPYFVDNPRIYNHYYAERGDSLYMDIVYPANASEKVPVVLSFSYSNSYHGNIHQRLFLGYTLAMFNDSFLEGAPASGMAWAIADHPKYCPWGQPAEYKSFQVNPDAAQKVKSAVRTLRVLGEELGLSGEIGIYGFSRGSDAGSMAVGDRADFITENAGFNIGVSDEIQAAALGPGVFDFTQIYNFIDDGDRNLEELCRDMWGKLEDNYQLWNSMGAAYFVVSSASAPVLFFYNTDDSHYYIDQIKHFKMKLESFNVPTDSLINFGSGHAVPQTSESLSKLYSFFNQYLATEEDTSQTDTTGVNRIEYLKPDIFPIDIIPNPVTDIMNINMNLQSAGMVHISVYNISGMLIYMTEEYFNQAGINRKVLAVNKSGISKGTYFVKVNAGKQQGIVKFAVY